jgi:L-cysteate sulfo-lyase
MENLSRLWGKRDDCTGLSTGGSDMQAEMEAVAARLAGEGLRPYVIPGGGSNPLGALGYVNAALELVNQSAERGHRTWALLGLPGELPRETVAANCDYVGDGYGIPTQGTVEAVTLLANTEGLLVDLVYSGKGMTGLVDLVRKGHFKKEDNVVFLHTGGSVALFGCPGAFGHASC